ncbi:unnamed protein product [Caenorhabditis brenneri]
MFSIIRLFVFFALILSMVSCVEPTHNLLQRNKRDITVTTEPLRKIPSSHRTAHSHDGHAHDHSGHTHAARRHLVTRRPSGGQFKLRH